MKYSDQQRIQKIYENAVKLHEYIVVHQIKKADLLTEIPMQWLYWKQRAFVNLAYYGN